MKFYYPDSRIEWDPAWPDPMGDGVNPIGFTDSDQATDEVSGRSKTGVYTFVGSNLYKSTSKMQKSVSDSTYSAELKALGAAVDDAKNLVFTMWSLGVNVNLPVKIFTDSKSVCDNVSIPGSPLKKKHEAIIYHKCREGIATGFFEYYHVDGSENPADINTKVTTKYVLFKHSGNIMSGQKLV